MNAVNRHLWDASLGFYVALNTSAAAEKSGTRVVKNRCDDMGFPLWAGMANASQAASIRAQLMASDMLSAYGIRSTSAADPRYNNKNEIKPYSNWQGPVWVVSNAILTLGLARYGYRTDAMHISSLVVSTLARDLESTATWHEAYSSDTGEGLAAAGFLSWDTLGATWPEHLAAGNDPFALHA